MQSIIEARGEVDFPEFTGERIYMEEFHQRDGLPSRFSRWQATIDAMLMGITTDLPIYLMVDQKVVHAGNEHRRAGLHIDGYWNPHGWVRGHVPAPPCHAATPAPEPAPEPSRPTPGHSPRPFHSSKAASWSMADFASPEGIILASSLAAARGFVGEYHGVVGDMGDCSSINTDHLTEMLMDAGRVYAGNVACLHESLPVVEDCQRTLVRLNVPGWSPDD